MINRLLPLFTLACMLSSCIGVDDSKFSSPHYRGGRFVNSAPRESEHGLWDVLKMRFTSTWSEWPEKVNSSVGPKPASKVSGNEIVVTHINHSSFLLQSGGVNLLTDPIFSDRCSPVSFAGPKRIRKPAINFADLPKIDVILISHDHYDHLDLVTLKDLVDRDNPKIYMGLGVSQRLDFKADATEMDWWQKARFSQDLDIHFVETQHFSGRGLFDRFKTLWGGFVLSWQGRKIYFGGDTGFGSHFERVYKKYGAMDLSLIPIGAYDPRWFMGYMHIDPYEAVKAHKILHSRVSLGMHYGTFQLTAEPYDEPPLKLRVAMKSEGIKNEDFMVLEHGKAYLFR